MDHDVFRPAILYVDDEKINLDTFVRAFGADYLVKTCLSGEEALQILETEDFPVILVDQKMTGMSGVALCERLVEYKPQSLRIMLTAYSDPQLLLDAIHRGHVHDYVVKPWKKSELKPVLDNALASFKERSLKLRELTQKAAQAESLQEQMDEMTDFSGIIGASSGLKPITDVIAKAAPTDATILIFGETGTGKELLAQAIHQNSTRKNAAFVALHCAALSPTILESELFGHEKGAFTGADKQKPGRFERANGGTLFLDEIGEISEAVQIKLLRVLQEKEIERVGGTSAVKVNVRLVAATNKDLKGMVAKGTFREDLYFRLNVIPVSVPPLRERKGDIETLAGHFTAKSAKQAGRPLHLTKEALTLLQQYDWPGNVRELQNILERAAILCSDGEITPADLNLDVTAFSGVDRISPDKLEPSKLTVRQSIQREEAEELSRALREAGGNISEAARILGMARSSLFHRLKKYGLI